MVDEPMGPVQIACDAKSLDDLQWAHATLLRLTTMVQRNGLMGERLALCVVQIAKTTVLLEGVIQEFLVHARRRTGD